MNRSQFFISALILNSLLALWQNHSYAYSDVQMNVFIQKNLTTSDKAIQKIEDGLYRLKFNDELNCKQKEECNNNFKPVTGIDKRCYLNKCLAKKSKIRIKHTGYDSANFVYNDYYSWPIERVCIPMYKVMPVITDLNDGTFHYQIGERQFRGTQNTCKCLPWFAKVSCPQGEVNIADLITGDTVWTISIDGEKIAVPILITNKVAVDNRHEMICIDLADGRNIKVTAAHPSVDKDSSIGDFEIGDLYDGSLIINKYVSVYTDNSTYDILPDGETGFYWINGILVGSTLFLYNCLVNNTIYSKIK
ncbi:MAG: hypothetical protein IPO27_18780 [Bacteroidetes bacterium]|nr:hypothetical protein [Bacteroidota bacterium]